MTAPLIQDEFDRMEALLAALLPHCDADEEAVLLSLHARLCVVFERQSAERRSLERLQTLSTKRADA